MFVKTQVPKTGDLAFLPETLFLQSYSIMQPKFGINAYWSEFSNGKPSISVFGMVVVLFDGLFFQDMKLDHDNFTYDDLLTFAYNDKRTWNAVNRQSIYRNRNTVKPFAIGKDSWLQDHTSECSQADLHALSLNRSFIPANADGWYSLKKNNMPWSANL